MPKGKNQEFDPNNPTPKDEIKWGPGDQMNYNSYVKDQFAKSENPSVLDRNDWYRMQKQRSGK
jgi:hypothetical protein